MTPVQMVITLVQILLAVSSLILAFTVARRTTHEKRKEPFTVTDLQSVSDSKWVSNETRKAAKKELARRTSSMEFRAEISSVDTKVDETVVERLRLHQSGLAEIRNNPKLTYFVGANANLGKMYASISWPEVCFALSCLVFIVSVLFLLGNLVPSVFTFILWEALFISFGVIPALLWEVLHRCKLTCQYIDAAAILIKKPYKKGGNFISLKYGIGKWIMAHPRFRERL